jgi:hypothetical protein
MRDSATRLLHSALGLPCWQVRWDNQVGLDLNLGPPHMSIRQPRQTTARSPRVVAMFARRLVRLHGTHWLRVSAEAWDITLSDGTRARRSSSARNCDIACARLHGEQLIEVSIDTRSGATEFKFDLGGVVRARRPRGWGDVHDAELWSLHAPRNRHVTVFAGGTYVSGLTTTRDGKPEPVASQGWGTGPLVIGRRARRG